MLSYSWVALHGACAWTWKRIYLSNNNLSRSLIQSWCWTRLIWVGTVDTFAGGQRQCQLRTGEESFTDEGRSATGTRCFHERAGKRISKQRFTTLLLFFPIGVKFKLCLLFGLSKLFKLLKQVVLQTKIHLMAFLLLNQQSPLKLASTFS